MSEAPRAAGPVRVLAWPARANVANPYNRLLYDKLEQSGVAVTEYAPGALGRDDWDVLHVHWPEFLVAGRSTVRAAAIAAAFFRRVERARARGRRVVWTMHNLAPHDRHPLGRSVYRAMIRCADAVICLSEAGREQAIDRYPVLADRALTVVPHGHYRGAYPDDLSPAVARVRLGIRDDHRVLLFFGAVRAYKGMERLLGAFAGLDDPDAVLVIAGTADEQASAAIRHAAATDTRIRARLGFVPDDDVQCYLRAADLVVLPYAETISSGVAVLALSFERPVLAPDTGALRELGARVGARWVPTFDELTPPVLDAALSGIGELDGRQPSLVALEWDGLAAAVAAVYAQVLGPTPVAAPT